MSCLDAPLAYLDIRLSGAVAILTEEHRHLARPHQLPYYFEWVMVIRSSEASGKAVCRKGYL